MLNVLAVHGLWHDAWCWEPVLRLLAAAGVPGAAVTLPMTSLEDDMAVVRERLDAAPGPVLLAGHSYGGAVITGCGDHPAVAELVYLAAFALDAGESVNRVLPQSGIPDTELPGALVFSPDRRQISLDPAKARGLLYQDVPDELAAQAISRLRPVSKALFRGVPTVIGWRHRPSTYVVCTQDATVNPQLQRAMAARAGRRVEWPSGHVPLLSRPAEVAALLAEIANAAPQPH